MRKNKLYDRSFARRKRLGETKKKKTQLDRGIRYLKVSIGGGLENACLSMLEDEEFETLEQLVSVVFIDTDANNLEDLPEAIKLILSDVRAADLLEAIREFKARFPGWEALGDLEKKWEALGAAEALPAGLMTRRELGVLVILYALWRKPSEVRNFLLSQARELHRINVADCWKLNGAALKKYGLEVSYFFSSCGGTGSSEALNMRDLQHHLLTTDGGFVNVQFYAHILLPGTMLHRAIDPEALKANTWAFFLELMQRYKYRLGPLQLGHYLLPRKHRPFRRVYLYDEGTGAEQIFTSREQVNAVVKEVDKLMTLGPEGQEYRARSVDYHSTFPNIFSSAGCWILVYPYDEIVDAFALRSGIHWIEARPLKQLTADELRRVIQERFDDFVNRYSGLRTIPELNQDANGRPLRVNLTIVEGRPRDQLGGAIEDVSQRQLEEHRETLVANVQQHHGRFANVITAEVEALLKQPGGLDLAEAFLHALFSELATQKDALGEQVKRAQHESETHREQLQKVQHAGLRGRLMVNRRSMYMKRALRAKESQLRELRQQARLELAKQLMLHVQQLQQECKAWRDGFAQLQQRLTETLEDHWREAEKRRPICQEWVVCREEIDRMFEQHRDDVLAQTADGLNLKWDAPGQTMVLRYADAQHDHASRWSVVSPEGIDAHAGHFAPHWEEPADRSVEEILEERGQSPEQILAYLEHKGAPLIKIDDTTQIPAEKPLKILGSETKSFWGDLVGRTGLSIAATGNRHRLSLLYTVHGINPLEGLMQSKAWKKAYDDALAAGRSPHVFPDVKIDLDLSPGDEFGFDQEEVDHEPASA